MKFVTQSLLLSSVILLSACAGAAKDYDHMSRAAYQNKAQLRQSLVNGSEPMNEAAVHQRLAQLRFVLVSRT